jgi:thymidylate kinase
VIVIVEGTDLVGKSTLIEQLSGAYPWPVAKIRWALVGDAKAETIGMATATIEFLSVTSPEIILDRCYFSMWAYGEERDYLPDLIAAFDRVSSIVPTRLIALTATVEELTYRYERSPDLYHSLEIILIANDRYPSLIALLPASLPSLHVDTTSTPPDEVFALVDKFIRD